MSANDLARAEAVIGHLKDWADWCRGYRVRTGFSPKSAGFEPGGWRNDSARDDQYEAIDQERFRMIEACVDDLVPNQNAAIYRCYLFNVYRLRDYEQSLADAHVALASAFRRKGVMFL